MHTTSKKGVNITTKFITLKFITLTTTTTKFVLILKIAFEILKISFPLATFPIKDPIHFSTQGRTKLGRVWPFTLTFANLVGKDVREKQKLSKNLLEIVGKFQFINRLDGR